MSLPRYKGINVIFKKGNDEQKQEQLIEAEIPWRLPYSSVFKYDQADAKLVLTDNSWLIKTAGPDLDGILIKESKVNGLYEHPNYFAYDIDEEKWVECKTTDEAQVILRKLKMDDRYSDIWQQILESKAELLFRNNPQTKQKMPTPYSAENKGIFASQNYSGIVNNLISADEEKSIASAIGDSLYAAAKQVAVEELKIPVEAKITADDIIKFLPKEEYSAVWATTDEKRVETALLMAKRDYLEADERKAWCLRTSGAVEVEPDAIALKIQMLDEKNKLSSRRVSWLADGASVCFGTYTQADWQEHPSLWDAEGRVEWNKVGPMWHFSEAKPGNIVTPEIQATKVGIATKNALITLSPEEKKLSLEEQSTTIRKRKEKNSKQATEALMAQIKNVLHLDASSQVLPPSEESSKLPQFQFVHASVPSVYLPVGERVVLLGIQHAKDRAIAAEKSHKEELKAKIKEGPFEKFKKSINEIEEKYYFLDKSSGLEDKVSTIYKKCREKRDDKTPNAISNLVSFIPNVFLATKKLKEANFFSFDEKQVSASRMFSAKRDMLKEIEELHADFQKQYDEIIKNLHPLIKFLLVDLKDVYESWYEQIQIKIMQTQIDILKKIVEEEIPDHYIDKYGSLDVMEDPVKFVSNEETKTFLQGVKVSVERNSLIMAIVAQHEDRYDHVILTPMIIKLRERYIDQFNAGYTGQTKEEYKAFVTAKIDRLCVKDVVLKQEIQSYQKRKEAAEVQLAALQSNFSMSCASSLK